MSAGTASGPWAAFAGWTLRHRVLVLVLLAALSLVAFLAMRHVAFTADVARLLPEDHPHLRLAALLDEQQRPARTLWLLVEGDAIDDHVDGIAARLRGSPHLAEVATTTEAIFGTATRPFRDAPLWHLDAAHRQRLADRLAPAGRQAAVAELLEQLADDPIAGRELAVRDPLGLRVLFADADPTRAFGLQPGSVHAVLAGGREALLRLTGTEDAWNTEFSTALMADLQARLGDRAFRAFGGYAVATADSQRIRRDLEWSALAATIAVLGFLTWSMKSLRLPWLVALPGGLAIVWAVPLSCWLFGPLPSVAVGAAAVLLGLGDDFAVHYLTQYRAARLHGDHAAAVRAAHARCGPELWIDTAATVGAFLSLCASELAGLRPFGILLALGLALCLLATLLLLPLLLPFAGQCTWAERSRVAAAADRVGAGPRGRKVAFAGLALAALAWLPIGIDGIAVDAAPESLRPLDDPIARTRDDLERRLGVATVPVLLLWDERHDLAPLAARLRTLREQGHIRFWSGLDANADADTRAAVTAFRRDHATFVDGMLGELQAQGLAGKPFEPALRELQARLAADPAATAASAIELDGQRWRVVPVWTTQRLRDDAWRAFAAAATADLPHLRTYGTPVLIAELERILRADLLRTAGIALLLTCLFTAVFRRSGRHGLLALLPTFVGISLTLGALALLRIPLTLASFMAIPLLFGIAVGEGVHLVGHFGAGARTMGTVGVAVVRTTITSVLGFGALVFAQSPGLQEFGAIAGAGLFACLLASLLVLPPLVRYQSLAQQNH